MRKLYSTLVAIAAVALALPGAAHAQANKLTVGLPTTPPNVVHMPVIVARELGLYKKYGVEVETVQLEDGVKVFRATDIFVENNMNCQCRLPLVE